MINIENIENVEIIISEDAEKKKGRPRVVVGCRLPHEKASYQKKKIMYDRMVERCSNKYVVYRSYEDCEVCDEWQNHPERFFDWVEENYYEVPGCKMHVDKDLLVPGNRVYSPETCCILPAELNLTIASIDSVKPRILADGTFSTRLCIFGDASLLKIKDKNEDSFLEKCAVMKKKVLLAHLSRYVDYLPVKVIKAICEYPVFGMSTWYDEKCAEVKRIRYTH